jgi:hypothetical protein
MRERTRDNPFLSPEEREGQGHYQHPLKKNIGSIYRPKLIPVDESELTHWPPAVDTDQRQITKTAPPEWALRRHSPDSDSYPTIVPPPIFPLPPTREAVTTPTGSLSGPTLSARLSPGERVGQVSAFRTADQLYPTPPRRPSARRERLPTYHGSPNQSMEGILSFISTSTTPAPPSSPSISPSAEAAWDDSLRHSIPRRPKRRETDPARAVMTRSIGEESSIYSQTSQHQDDFALFYRAPLSSPSSTSPAKSVRSPGPYIPLRRSSIRPPPSAVLPGQSARHQSRSEIALSSLDRVRRDTGVDLGVVGDSLTPEAPDPARLNDDGSRGIERLSTTTWVSDDISPRASERGWWSNMKMGD